MQPPAVKRAKPARTQRYLWTREAYERLADTDIFLKGPRVELINGEIVEMSPQKSLHAGTILLVTRTLTAAFGPEYNVRGQLPLALGARSMPEPDVAVVRGDAREYLKAHPTEAVLLVEVAESSLSFDRGQKLRLYARHGIVEYWIVNLVNASLEVYRDPMGKTYGTKVTLTEDDRISPLAKLDASIAVADLLP